jgi:hypothetical protein
MQDVTLAEIQKEDRFHEIPPTDRFVLEALLNFALTHITPCCSLSEQMMWSDPDAEDGRRVSAVACSLDRLHRFCVLHRHAVSQPCFLVLCCVAAESAWRLSLVRAGCDCEVPQGQQGCPFSTLLSLFPSLCSSWILIYLGSFRIVFVWQMDLIIRSHECQQAGFDKTHDDTLITVRSLRQTLSNVRSILPRLRAGTEPRLFLVCFVAAKQVFSASNYCGTVGNDGAFVIFEKVNHPC